MPKDKDKLVDAPAVKPQIEDLLAEKDKIEVEEAKKAEDAVKIKEEEDKIPEVEVDLDAEREKTKQEVKDTIEKEVVEPLKKEIIDLKNTLTKDEKDDYDKFVDDYTEKNGKAPEWKQVATFLEDRAVKRVEDKQAQIEKERKDAEDTAKQEEETRATENFKTWQGQLQDMENQGMLPKMEKPEAGDVGFDARVQLYGLMQNTWKSGTPLTNLFEVHAKFGNQLKTTKQPAGADAPVSISETGGQSDDTKEYSYQDVHRGAQDLESFVLSELQKAGKNVK